MPRLERIQYSVNNFITEVSTDQLQIHVVKAFSSYVLLTTDIENPLKATDLKYFPFVLDHRQLTRLLKESSCWHSVDEPRRAICTVLERK